MLSSFQRMSSKVAPADEKDLKEAVEKVKEKGNNCIMYGCKKSSIFKVFVFLL